jgi:hypothetical protein
MVESGHLVPERLGRYDIRSFLLPCAGYQQGEQWITVEERSRERLYELELEAFVATLRGAKQPERSPGHDLLVQETLLRATGGMR